MLGEIVDHMLQKAKGELPKKLKAFIYSTHESLLSAILNGIGIFNNLTPPYCATVLIELHSDSEHEYTVKILYLNSSTPEIEPQTPVTLMLPDCHPSCKLEKFVQLTRDIIPVDIKKECGLTVEDLPILSKQAVVIVVMLGTTLFILSIITMSLILRRYCSREDGSSLYTLDSYNLDNNNSV